MSKRKKKEVRAIIVEPPEATTIHTDYKTYNPFYKPTYGEKIEEGFNMIHKNDMEGQK